MITIMIGVHRNGEMIVLGPEITSIQVAEEKEVTVVAVEMVGATMAEEVEEEEEVKS